MITDEEQKAADMIYGLVEALNKAMRDAHKAGLSCNVIRTELRIADHLPVLITLHADVQKKIERAE